MNVRNDLQPVQPLDQGLQIAPSGKPSDHPDTPAQLAGSDQAHLSSGATLVSQMASLPEVRSEKVQAIQMAIANGSYNVASVDVAHSMIDHMLRGGE